MIADILLSWAIVIAIVAIPAGVYYIVRGLRFMWRREIPEHRLQSFGDIVHSIAARGSARRARLSVHCAHLVLAEARCSARSGK